MKKRIFTLTVLLLSIAFCLGCQSSGQDLAAIRQRLDDLETQLSSAPWKAAQAELDDSLHAELAALSDEIALLKATPAPTEPPSSESLPENGVVGDAITYEVDGYKALLKYNEESGYWFSALSHADFQPKYSVNNLNEGYMEYQFAICFTVDGKDYEVGTTYFKSGKAAEKTIPLTAMQHSVWLVEGNEMSTVSDAELSVDGAKLIWTFKQPKPVDLTTLHITGISIVVAGQYLEP